MRLLCSCCCCCGKVDSATESVSEQQTEEHHNRNGSSKRRQRRATYRYEVVYRREEFSTHDYLDQYPEASNQQQPVDYSRLELPQQPVYQNFGGIFFLTRTLTPIYKKIFVGRWRPGRLDV